MANRYQKGWMDRYREVTDPLVRAGERTSERVYGRGGTPPAERSPQGMPRFVEGQLRTTPPSQQPQQPLNPPTETAQQVPRWWPRPPQVDVDALPYEVVTPPRGGEGGIQTVRDRATGRLTHTNLGVDRLSGAMQRSPEGIRAGQNFIQSPAGTAIQDSEGRWVVSDQEGLRRPGVNRYTAAEPEEVVPGAAVRRSVEIGEGVPVSGRAAGATAAAVLNLRGRQAAAQASAEQAAHERRMDLEKLGVDRYRAEAYGESVARQGQGRFGIERLPEEVDPISGRVIGEGGLRITTSDGGKFDLSPAESQSVREWVQVNLDEAIRTHPHMSEVDLTQLLYEHAIRLMYGGRIAMVPQES